MPNCMRGPYCAHANAVKQWVTCAAALWYERRMAKGPGPVAWAHRLLIGTALAGAIFYTAWEFRGYTSSGEPAALARAGIALVASGALALYLRGLRARLAARLTPHEEGNGA